MVVLWLTVVNNPVCVKSGTGTRIGFDPSLVVLTILSKTEGKLSWLYLDT